MRKRSRGAVGQVAETTVRHRPRTTRGVIAAAWREFQVTKQCAGGGLDLLTTWEVPGWFKGHELGLAPGNDRSIVATLAWLELINARNLATLRDRAAPTTSKRTSAKQKQAQLRRLGKKAAARLAVVEQCE